MFSLFRVRLKCNWVNILNKRTKNILILTYMQWQKLKIKKTKTNKQQKQIWTYDLFQSLSHGTEKELCIFVLLDLSYHSNDNTDGLSTKCILNNIMCS